VSRRLSDYLRALARQRTDQLVVVTMQAAAYWPRFAGSDLDFKLIGCMGVASPIGLGLALAQPQRRVIVCEGDGSLLMNLGVLATIGAQAPENLLVLLMDNGAYATTGGQPLPGAGKLDLLAVAKGAGISRTYSFSDSSHFAGQLDRLLGSVGPIFARLDCSELEPFIAVPPEPTAAQVAVRVRNALLGKSG